MPTPGREIAQLLANYIVEEVASRRPDQPPAPDVPIIETGLVDSLGLFKLIAFIEDELGAKIDAADIVLENFATIGAIVVLVERKLGGVR